MRVDALNYHHLHYFWMVAREGSIAAACEQLDVSQPTISAQIRALERSLGLRLFERQGRGLVLTDAGRVAYRYADEIFSLGRELRDVISGRPAGHPLRLSVGVIDALPKLVVAQLLEPALHLEEPVRIVCTEGKVEELLSDLARHRLDIVLSDAPIAPGAAIRAFNHLLGECGVSLFAPADLAEALSAGFPSSITGAPILMPGERTTLRRSLDHWLDDLGLRPRVVGEFVDSALMKAFGHAGAGLFPAPTVIERQVCEQYGVAVVGRVEQVREQFYAISIERRLKHPAVVAVFEAARRDLFS
ncbi:transcriptional activator NhaR [Tautonia plasticadhaerens]|uniref:Transcriptional activator protein NhaR n=1 Tax=Tautonia plasticadhaerens TaxID=2527974 RepID=A0A518H6L0_9BACT|nr:transcriptional activator NhaR [Tautonia plasticadhaerens]QDV36481.1 Transcriptional activator protein NhaR [Tautonia plasticadhaerens]